MITFNSRFEFKIIHFVMQEKYHPYYKSLDTKNWELCHFHLFWIIFMGAECCIFKKASISLIKYIASSH